MRRIIAMTLLISISLLQRSYAQQETEHLFRFYHDNDFINFRGEGTDEAYTYGNRFDLFYSRRKKPRLLPTAGDSSINITGWSLMQMAITPRDISTTAYQPDDYQYAGTLFAVHSLRSYNPVKKYSLHSEILLGMMGPAAGAEEGQKLLHRIIHYQQPMGWQYQFDNAPLINVQLAAEKQLWAAGKWLEVIGGAQVAAGTMTNSAAIYPLIRIGYMHPYFSGFISQYTSPRTMAGRQKWQGYLIGKPSGTLTLTNALLTGGIGHTPERKNQIARYPLEKWGFTIEYGIVASKGRFAFSFIQTRRTTMVKKLYGHEVGNISLYFNW
jgi:lipid A 3-O-deacylase